MGLFSWIGDVINDITGVNSSAKKQKNNQLEIQHDAQNFAKWQMNNAHQAEVTDLQKAGLNPVLSAGGSGASAGVTEGSASVGTGADPATMISSIIGAMNSAKQTETMSKKADAEIENIEADTQNKKQTFEWTPMLNKSLMKLQNAQSVKAKAEAATEAGKQLAYQFENKMAEMNVKKRSEEWYRELKIYEKQMQTEMTMAGYNTSNWNMALKKFGEIIKSISPFGDMVPNVSTNYNVTTNYAPR